MSLEEEIAEEAKVKRGNSLDPFIDKNGYYEILSAIIKSDKEDGEVSKESESIPHQSYTPKRSKSKAPIEMSFYSTKWFLGITAFFVINLAVLGLTTFSTTDGLTADEAELELIRKYGEDYNQIRALDTFLEATEDVYSSNDPTLMNAIDDYESLYEDEGADQSFVPENFQVRDDEILYRE